MAIDVITIIADSLGVDADKISAESDSDSVAGWDSLAQVDLIAALERLIGDRLSPREIARMTSVRNVVTVLEARELDVAALD